jgi:hypothetical protein
MSILPRGFISFFLTFILTLFPASPCRGDAGPPGLSSRIILAGKKDSGTGRKEMTSPPLKAPGYLPPIWTPPTPAPRLIPAREEFQSEGPYRIKFLADEVVNKNGVTTAVGNVRAEYKGTVIKAHRISFDQASRQVDASGDVTINRGKDELSGEKLDFNLETQRASITKARGRLMDAAIGEVALNNEIFFWGEEIVMDKTIQIRKGVISSCDKEPPDYHYHISGDEILIYPQDRIIVRKGRFFLGKTQVLGLNSLTLSLKPRNRNQHLLIPRVGKNQLEGGYIKESIGYQWGKRDYGTAMLDWYRRVGLGTGLEHFYHLGDKGMGRFNYYSMGSSRYSTNRYDLSNRLYYRFPGNYFVSASYTSNRYEYPEFSSPHIKNADFYASHNTDRSDSAIRVRDYSQGTSRNYGVNVFNKYRISEDLSSFIVMDYLSTEALASRQFRLNTLAGLVKKGDVFDTWLIMDHTRGDTNFYVNRLPEVSMRSHAFRAGPFDAKASMSVGSLREMPSDVSAVRSDLKLSLLNKVFPLGKSGDFAFAAGARQFVYGTGEKKYLVRCRSALEERLGNNFRFIFSHYYQDRNGYSPLALDYYDKYNLLGATFEIYQKDKARFQVTGAYDVERKTYQSIIPRLEVSPSKSLVFIAGSTYDYNNRLWMNIDGQVGLKVSKNVTLKYWSLYDLINKKMNYQNYVIELDSHDFATRFVYKGSQGELWMNIALKAFPGERVDVGPDSQRSVINKDLLEGAPDSERI